MKKLFLTSVLAALSAFVLSAQQPAGGISPEMLEQISATYEDNAYDKAISNALAGTSIATLAINADNAAMIACCGYYQYQKTQESRKLDINGLADLQL